MTSQIAFGAPGILALKGFATITYSGSKLKDPRRGVSRAIVISLLMAWAVASALFTILRPRSDPFRRSVRFETDSNGKQN